MITWAIFQSDGNTFSRKDLLNKLHNGFDISSFTDTNILLLIISGPTALLALRVHNISITSYSVTITWDRIFSHLSWKSGKTASSSFNLVIERKYLFKTLDSCYWIMSSMFYREWKPCLFIAWESAHLVQCFGKPFHLRCLPWKNACYLSTQLPCYTTRNYTLWTFSFEANSWLTCLLLNAEQSTSCHELPSYPLLPFTCFELAFYLKI